MTGASGLSLAEIERYRLAVGTVSRYFLPIMRKPLDFKTVDILLTGRYSPFWLWMQGIMLGFAINTMIGTWKPSEFRWASVSVQDLSCGS